MGLKLAAPLAVLMLVVSVVAVGAASADLTSCTGATTTADDVIRIYRQQLGRDPEDQGAIAGRLGLPCRDVEKEIAGSVEAMVRRGDANALLAEGKRVFRYDTFGDEAFWGDTLGLHKAIIGAKNGGVGDGVSPKTALAVGLKVDVDALPNSIVDALKAGKVDLDDPATTVALLKLNAVVGVTAFTNPDGSVRSMGIQCALCHSTVDDSFIKGIGHRIDGWPNRDLNVGAIVSLAPNLQPVADVLGVDVPTVKKVIAAWGPGKFDAELFMDGKGFRPDGKTAATLIPPAYGLAGVNLHTYTGWGSITYWNAFVANLEMHGVGNFFDPRLDDATKFPVAAAARNKSGHVSVSLDKDQVTAKLAPLHLYQLSLKAPKLSADQIDRTAATAGKAVFEGKAKCATCHVPPLFSEPGWNMHLPADIGIDDFQASRSPDGRYRTTPLGGVGVRSTQQGGFFHDGRFATLSDVVNYYNTFFKLNLTDTEKQQLVEYLKSL